MWLNVCSAKRYLSDARACRLSRPRLALMHCHWDIGRTAHLLIVLTFAMLARISTSVLPLHACAMRCPCTYMRAAASSQEAILSYQSSN